MKSSGVGHIEIERFSYEDRPSEMVVYIHVSQIGLFMSNERELSDLHRGIKRILGRSVKVTLEPVELANPAVCANLLAEEIVDVLEGRMPHRIAVKRLMKRAILNGASGIKVKISGRINGVEIARSEGYAEGSVPLSTFRADIDYSYKTAKTSYGIIGVKVWVNRGLYFGKKFMPLPAAAGKSSWKNDKNKESKHILTTH